MEAMRARAAQHEGSASSEEERTQTGAAGTALTTEYDVFGCGSFEMDQGKWLRLMPDAEVLPT